MERRAGSPRKAAHNPGWTEWGCSGRRGTTGRRKMRKWWRRRRRGPALVRPSSASSYGFETRSWSASPGDWAGRPSPAAAAGTGSGWNGTPSPAPPVARSCRLCASVWRLGQQLNTSGWILDGWVEDKGEMREFKAKWKWISSKQLSALSICIISKDAQLKMQLGSYMTQWWNKDTLN